MNTKDAVVWIGLGGILAYFTWRKVFAKGDEALTLANIGVGAASFVSGLEGEDVRRTVTWAATVNPVDLIREETRLPYVGIDVGAGVEYLRVLNEVRQIATDANVKEEKVREYIDALIAQNFVRARHLAEVLMQADQNDSVVAAAGVVARRRRIYEQATFRENQANEWAKAVRGGDTRLATEIVNDFLAVGLHPRDYARVEVQTS